MQTLEWREQLKATAKSSRIDQPALVEKLRDAKQKLAKRLRSMGLDEHNNAKNMAEGKLNATYYSRWLSAKYPTVDLSFTDSALELLVRRTESGAEIVGVKDREPESPTERTAKVKRFAVQSENGRRRDLFADFPDRRCTLGTFSFTAFQRGGIKYRDYTAHVMCSRPAGSPRSLKRKLRDIAATLMEAEAAAIRAGVGIGSPEPGRTILWLPRIEDLYITEQIPVRDDPAVLVTIGDASHLVAFWDSPEESPIEGVLREFSEGTFDEIT